MAKKSRLFSYRFHLPQLQSPSFRNLHNHLTAMGWHASKRSWFSHFGERNFDFDATAAKILEYKHLLSWLVSRHCPDTMPESYTINDSNWPTVLSQIAENHYIKDNTLIDSIENLAWILKPSTLNNGQHIKLFNALSMIEEHYLNANRMGGDHVLQKYIINPHLLENSKYSIRMFVILTNYDGVFLYPNGYFNRGLHAYQADNLSDLRSHLTNEHLHEHESNVTQIPTFEFGNIFPSIYPQIKSIVKTVTNSLQHTCPEAFVCKKNRTLAIYGFDFMVDANQRVWLIEANHGPCFPIHQNHPLQATLYSAFWNDFITDFVSPISTHQSRDTFKYSMFEKC